MAEVQKPKVNETPNLMDTLYLGGVIEWIIITYVSALFFFFTWGTGLYFPYNADQISAMIHGIIISRMFFAVVYGVGLFDVLERHPTYLRTFRSANVVYHTIFTALHFVILSLNHHAWFFEQTTSLHGLGLALFWCYGVIPLIPFFFVSAWRLFGCSEFTTHIWENVRKEYATVYPPKNTESKKEN